MSVPIFYIIMVYFYLLYISNPVSDVVEWFLIGYIIYKHNTLKNI